MRIPQPSLRRVLLVDDFKPWLRYAVSAIVKDPAWTLVALASDGLDAVQQAAAHQPEVILLDIGLPSLDGLEVAQRILKRHPTVAILFVTALNSVEIAKAALAIGARGYILKPNAPNELLAAMHAIAQGGRFIGAGLGSLSESRIVSHDVGFYTDESLLIDEYARVAGPALENGHTFMVATCAARREHLRDRLSKNGVDVERALREDRYREVDPSTMIDGVIVDGSIDERRFWTLANSLFGIGAHADGRIVACGDCAPTLLSQGNARAAIQLEYLWDEFSRAHRIDTFCGYLMSATAEHEHAVETLRAAHSCVRAG
jgi:CheY-like chemotaxis protein